MNLAIKITDFKDALLNIDRVKANDIVEKIEKTDQKFKIIEEALEIIGKGWEEGEIALSQVYMGGDICEEITKNILGTVDNFNQETNIAIVNFNDYHPLGKKIVYSILRSRGIDLLDYGHGVEIKSLIDKIIKDKIDILLISVLMLPAALNIAELRKKLNAIDKNVKIIVGGAPFKFDNNLWKEIGADAMGRNPNDAYRFINHWKGGL